MPPEPASFPARRRAGIRQCLGVLASVFLITACAGPGPRLQALQSGTEAERIRVIAGITASGEATDDVIAALGRSLDDPSEAVRWEAAGALGRIGPRAAKALPALERCAQTQQDALALRCAQAGAGIGPLALPGLRALLGSADPTARRRGALALTGLGPAAAPATDDLISLLGDLDPAISAGAKDALVAIGIPALLPLLRTVEGQNVMPGIETSLRKAALATIDSMKPYPRTLLLELLARGDPASVWAARQIRAQGLEADAVPVLVHIIETERPNVAAWAVRVLRGFGEKAAPAIPALVAALEGFDIGAEAALADIGPPAMPVVETLLTAEAEESRIHGIRILGAMRPLPMARLLDIAHGSDETLRVWATDILGSLKDADVPTLLTLARDTDPRIRGSAVHALGQIPALDESGAALLSLLVLEDPDKWIRARAAQALGQIRPSFPQARSALAQALADPEKEVRNAAIAALARIGEEALPALIDAFRGNSGEARAGALAVFSSRRSEGLITDAVERGLRSRLAEDDAAVRTGAALALLVAGRASSQEVTIAAAALRSDDEALVRLALGALREAGKSAAAALPTLLEIGPDVSAQFAGEYLRTLASVGRRDPRLLPLYVDALRRGAGAKEACEGMEWFNDDGIASLVELLKQRDVAGMPEVEKSLIAHGRLAVPALEATLAGGPVAARRAATLLCKMDRVPPRAMEVFLDVLRQDAPSAWKEALICLEKAGPALAPHAELLMELYARIDDAEKGLVMLALGACGEAARPFVPVLMTALESPGGPDEGTLTRPLARRRAWEVRDRLRYPAIEALGRLGAVAADAVPLLTRLATAPVENSDARQRAAIVALGRIGPAAHAAIPTLLPFLDGPEQFGDDAWEALIAMAAPPDILVPRCLALLRAEPQQRRSLHALRYLLGMPREDPGLPALLEQLARGGALAFEATQELRRRRPPAGGPPLDAPVLRLAALKSYGVELVWGPGVPRATGYRLYRRQEPDGEWVLLEEVGGPGFTDRTIEPGRSYAYRIEPFNADLAGRSSGVQSIAIEGTAVREQLAPPTGLTVETALVQRGEGEIRVARLSWEPPHGWTCPGYVISRGLTGSNRFGTIGVSRSTSFVDEKLSADFSVSYFVRGIDSELRKSEASNEAVAAAADPRR